MSAVNSHYELIKSKIDALKNTYPSLRTKADDYVFSALCIKSNLYKNPAHILNEQDFGDMIVDGQYDGGVDVLLTDPSSDSSDLIIGQSKFYTTISSEDVMNALTKMALFYKDMLQGRYEQVNATVQRRFLTLYSELGEDAKIHFVFYTSALQSGINRSHLQAIFNAAKNDNSSDVLYDIFSDIEGINYFLPPALFESKDAYEAVLDKLFNAIINVGIVNFSMASEYDSTLTATNYLKKDKNYYNILRTHWTTLNNDIQRIFADINS